MNDLVTIPDAYGELVEPTTLKIQRLLPGFAYGQYVEPGFTRHHGANAIAHQGMVIYNEQR